MFIYLMVWSVYILFSENFKRTYVGFTQNIETRLKYHNDGRVISTKKFRPWKLVFEEKHENYTDARKRELYYKSGAGRRKMKVIFDELRLNN